MGRPPLLKTAGDVRLNCPALEVNIVKSVFTIIRVRDDVSCDAANVTDHMRQDRLLQVRLEREDLERIRRFDPTMKTSQTCRLLARELVASPLVHFWLVQPLVHFWPAQDLRVQA
jgi:hypothetical protein